MYLTVPQTLNDATTGGLFKLKDKQDASKSVDAIYKIGCTNCPRSYKGETAKPLYVRLRDHRAETLNITQGWAYTRIKSKESTDTNCKSALLDHADTFNNVLDWDSVKVLEQEQNWGLWGIMETIHTHANPQSLNRPQGKRRVARCLGLSLLCQQQQQEPRCCRPPHGQGRGG